MSKRKWFGPTSNRWDWLGYLLGNSGTFRPINLLRMAAGRMAFSWVVITWISWTHTGWPGRTFLLVLTFLWTCDWVGYWWFSRQVKLEWEFQKDERKMRSLL